MSTVVGYLVWAVAGVAYASMLCLTERSAAAFVEGRSRQVASRVSIAVISRPSDSYAPRTATAAVIANDVPAATLPAASHPVPHVTLRPTMEPTMAGAA